MRLDCPLCGTPQIHETIGSRDRRGNPLHSVLCLMCGLGRTHPLPTPQELAEFYADQYRRDCKSLEEPALYHVLRAGRLAVARLEMLRDVAIPGAKILDCGSGGGEFVYLARRLGCDAKGIEPNRGYANYARRELDIDIESGMLEDLAIGVAHYGLVTLFHVLEHIASPTEYLRRAASLLATGDAILAVEVPNLTASVSHPHRRYHRAHLYHFTESTLRAAAERAACTPSGRTTPKTAQMFGPIFAVARLRMHVPWNLRGSPAQASRGKPSRLLRVTFHLDPVHRADRQANQRTNASKPSAFPPCDSRRTATKF